VNAFVQEVGRRLADRWLVLLVLPGLLWCAAAVVGLLLGHLHALDPSRLAGDVEVYARRVQHAGSVATVAALAGLALAASAAGLAARLAGAGLQRCWLGEWPRWFAEPARRLTARRLRRWNDAAVDYERAVRSLDADRGEVELLALRRNRICLAAPTRPTWIGDRIAAVDARVLADYQLDLASAWPRLWLLLDDSARAELRSARGEFDAATGLGGWGVLYTALAVVWWPAAVVAGVCGVAGWMRARSAIAAFADLVEATVDLRGPDLGAALRLTDSPQRLTPALGREITRQLRKGA
jgi:hypothetical protein